MDRLPPDLHSQASPGRLRAQGPQPRDALSCLGNPGLDWRVLSLCEQRPAREASHPPLPHGAQTPRRQGPSLHY